MDILIMVAVELAGLGVALWLGYMLGKHLKISKK